MGRNTAHDLANGSLPLEAALTYHLRNNHYPPLPMALVKTCQTIIRRYAAGDTKARVRLPKGITYRGKSLAPFWSCVNAWHLHEFLQRQGQDCED